MTPDEFYSHKNNCFYIRMKEILDFRRSNPLHYINEIKNRPATYIKCQRHHIIPRSWYRHHGYTIDNSYENTIYLTPSEHLEVHVLLREYFKSINDLDMYYSMALAIDKMTNGNSQWIDTIVNNDIEKSFYLKIYEENINIAAEATAYRYKTMTPEERMKLSQHISDGWKNMDKDTYDNLCKKRVEIGKMLWTDQNYKTGSDEWKKHQSESQKRAQENKSEMQKEIEKQKRADTWKNMPEKRKQQLKDDQSRIQTERWKNISDEERKKHGEKISNAYKNTTPEHRALHRKRQSESIKKHFASLSDEEREKMRKKCALASKGRKFMSNDKLMKTIQAKPEQIQELLNQGWFIGNKSRIYKKLKSAIQQDT